MLLIVVHKSSFRFKQVLHTREAQQSHTKNYIEECYSPTATSSGRIDRYVPMYSTYVGVLCVHTRYPRPAPDLNAPDVARVRGDLCV